MPQNKKTKRIEGKAKANKAAFSGLTGMTKRKPYVPKGHEIELSPTDAELADQMVAAAALEPDLVLGEDESDMERIERETRPDGFEGVNLEHQQQQEENWKATEPKPGKATELARPSKETGDFCTFAIRIPRSESAAIHRAAGSGKASKWARQVLLLAAAGDVSGISSLLASWK
jgi:hypothetical protein